MKALVFAFALIFGGVAVASSAAEAQQRRNQGAAASQPQKISYAEAACRCRGTGVVEGPRCMARFGFKVGNGFSIGIPCHMYGR